MDIFSPSLFLFVSLFCFLLLPVGSVSEAELLLSFKASIEDPMNNLATWSNTSVAHFCNWAGITCATQSPPSVLSLDLHSLNLSGEISPSICQLPRLLHLNLASNLFNQPIPLHLSQCHSLQSLNLSGNLIWGPIPDQISLLSSLIEIDLSRNNLQGKIPQSLGFVKSLQVLNLRNNSFSGIAAPTMFDNLTELLVLDLSENSLASEIPSEMGKLKKLEKLLLQNSGFLGGIPQSFVNLHELVILDVSGNNLSGNIPLGLGSGLEKIVSYDLSENMLSGFFPTGICNGQSLIELNLHTNFFSGMIPDSLQNCVNLEKFQVQGNQFLGNFPPGLWSLPKIKLIRAENNQFSGGIPTSVSKASQLEHVQIDNNSFAGKISQGLGQLTNLYRFSASLNAFYGEIPDNFCNSPVLSIIDLSHNSLSGRIPELTKCRKLVSLSLADNSFTGNIPSSLAKMPVLTYIDLSNNNLSGEIPRGLEDLKLALFNVSFNRLSGAVPFNLVSGLPASFLQGNPDLCGPGLPNLCEDEEPKRRSARSSALMDTLIAIAFVVGVIIVAAIFFVLYRYSHRNSSSITLRWVLLYPLKVTEGDLIKALDEKNCVGCGSFGKVNIINLPSGDIVVVKKLMNVGGLSSKALKSEIKLLAKVRHKNIVKMLGSCYSDDSIFLIYEYMPKGSLGDLITTPNFSLEWAVRLRIAMGVARGLAYLHKDYVLHLLHRNLKSRNILLNMDFEPKLTDYGLDRIVGETGYDLAMASDLACNSYMAPEYGCSRKATEQMDVYSFGVVLLELITGRSAEKPFLEGNSIDIVQWVRRKVNLENGSLLVLDPSISSCSKPEMLAALELALHCTSVMPDKRPTVFEVIRSLQFIEPKSQPCRSEYYSSVII